MNAYALRVIINIYIPLEPIKTWTERKRETQAREQFNNIKPQYQQHPKWNSEPVCRLVG